MITTDIIINYLNYYNYHQSLFNKELGIRKYVNLLEKQPILDVNMEDPDVQKVEL